MKNRVSAKLAGVRQHFSCFALRRLHRISEVSGEEKQRLKAAMCDSVQELGKIFSIDSRILLHEYREVSGVAAQLYKEELAKQPAASANGTGDPVWFDNRTVWKRFLDNDFIQAKFKTRVSPFTALQTLLRVYMSILDGESQCERDLGSMRQHFKNMRGRCAEDLLNDLLILKLSGPQTADAAGGTFAQQCAKLWSKHMGNHSLHTRPRARRQPARARVKASKKETFAEARRAALRASVRAKTQEHRNNEMTKFGVRANVLNRPLDDQEELNPEMQRFETLTKKI